MTDLLAYLSAGFSLAAAILAALAWRRRPGGELAELVRSEADRSRTDLADQARGLREELGGKLERGQDAVRLSLESRLDAADRRQAEAARALREELTTNFRLSSEQWLTTLKEMSAQQKERLDGLLTQLTQLSEKQAAAAEALRATVDTRLETIRTANEQKLEQMRQTVEEKLQSTLEQRLGESFRTVSEQLKAVHQGLGEMQSLATGVGDLKKVLTNVKTRGTWGEVQLGALLEQFLAPDQFVRNAQCRPESAERVEFAVRFSSPEDDTDLLLPIDAKFPQDDYERLLAAAEGGDAAGVETAGAALETRVRSFAKAVAEKYINPPVTTDFAVLFLPTESLFAEILRRPGFFDGLQRDYRVTLAGPTTLASMLNAFQMGFRSLAIQKRSSEVWKLLAAVRSEFAEHGKVVDTLKRQLGAATNTIDRLGTRTRAMNRKLRDVEVLPSGAARNLLGFVSPENQDDAASDEDPFAE
ncbi:MAG: DNA recombination protein RmuC [Alphaproteobacteria bacterium]|nr:DNA recombination protein RmuC [Alphaproteobacteria bacterium]